MRDLYAEFESGLSEEQRDGLYRIEGLPLFRKLFFHGGIRRKFSDPPSGSSGVLLGVGLFVQPISMPEKEEGDIFFEGNLLSLDGDSYAQGIITNERLTFIEFYQKLHSEGDFGIYDLRKKSDSDEESLWVGQYFGSKYRKGKFDVEMRVMGRSLEERNMNPIDSDSYSLHIPQIPLETFWRWMKSEGFGYANPNKIYEDDPLPGEEDNSDFSTNADGDPFF